MILEIVDMVTDNILSIRTKMAASEKHFEPQEIDHSIRTTF